MERLFLEGNNCLTFIFILCIALLSNCTSEVERGNNVVKKIDINADDIYAKSDSIIRRAELIPLEFNEKSVLNSIDKVILDNENIILFDSKESQVVIYDTTGTYKTLIKRIGNGPNEYLFLRDIIYNYNKEEVGLLAQKKGSLIWFNLSGEPVSSNTIGRRKLILDKGFLINKKIYHFVHNPKTYNDHFQFNVTDMFLKNIEVSHFKTNINNITVAHQHPFGRFKDNVTLHLPYDYCLYKVDEKLSEPRKTIQFDFGKRNIPKELLTKLLLADSYATREDAIKLNNEHKNYVKLQLVVPLKDYILLGYDYKFQKFYALIDVKTGNSRVFRGSYKEMLFGKYIGCSRNANIVYFEMSQHQVNDFLKSESSVKLTQRFNFKNLTKNNPWILKLKF